MNHSLLKANGPFNIEKHQNQCTDDANNHIQPDKEENKSLRSGDILVYGNGVDSVNRRLQSIYGKLHGLTCCLDLCHNSVQGIRGGSVGLYIACGGDNQIQESQTDAAENNTDGAVDGHGHAITTEAVLPFQMIQYIRKQCHKYIGAGKRPYIFDELSHQHNGHVGGCHPADGTAKRTNQTAENDNIPLAHLFRQRPNGKDADAHGNTANHIQQGLSNAVGIGAQHIVAVINSGVGFQRR